MASHLRRLFSRRKPQNVSVSAESANNESIVTTRMPNSVLPQSEDVVVLSNHNGKRLCSWCRGLSIESLAAPGGYMHAPPGKDLPEECALCDLLMFDSNYHGGPRMLSLFREDSYTRTSDVYIEFSHWGQRRRSRTRLTVLVLPGDPALDYGLPALPALTTTASLESFEAVKRWLQECLSHPPCCKPLDCLANDRPTRLLDLDAFGDYSTAVRLQDASRIQEKYAVLSYCWGAIEGQRFLTTSSTINSRMSRIEYSDVPRTFQHAFGISKTLGIRYLWIDALCILQDSAPDWNKESSKMGAIYSNSHITIAADWSPDTNGGCYHPTADSLPKEEEMIKITNILSDGRESSLYFMRQSDGVPDIESSVLNTRAWTFQERLLSRRIVHYTDKQVYWECRSIVRAEDSISRRLGSNYPYPGVITSHLPVTSRSSDSSRKVLRLWYDSIIYNRYALRKLTHASDRLPAVSALAKIFSQFTNSSYLAGLWDYSLQWGLSWRREGNSPPASRLSNHCPTWSWASLDSDVWWGFGSSPGKEEKSFIRVQQSYVKIEGEDPFGRVRGGSIKLTGRIKKCKLVGHHLAAWGRAGITAEDGTPLGAAYMDTDESVSQAYCLLLSSRSTLDAGDGLVLSLTSVERQEYRRLGFADLYGVDWLTKVSVKERSPIESLFQDCTKQIVLV